MTKITEKKRLTKIEVVGYTCDVCETDFRDTISLQEFLHYSDVGSYGSEIGDGVSKEIDICESCVIKVLGKWLKTN